MNDFLSHLADQAMGTLSDLEPWLPPTFAAPPDDRDVVSEIEPTAAHPTAAPTIDIRFEGDRAGSAIESQYHTKLEGIADQAETRVSRAYVDTANQNLAKPRARVQTTIPATAAPADTPYRTNDHLAAAREPQSPRSGPAEVAPAQPLLLPKLPTKNVINNHAIQPAAYANDSITPTGSSRRARENYTRPIEPATTKIEVTIGRIEIRAASPGRKASPKQPRPVENKTLSLSDYLTMRGRRHP